MEQHALTNAWLHALQPGLFNIRHHNGNCAVHCHHVDDGIHNASCWIHLRPSSIKSDMEGSSKKSNLSDRPGTFQVDQIEQLGA